MSETIEEQDVRRGASLTEAEAKSLLADAGLSIPAFRVVTEVEDAVSAAESIGYPVVAKVSSRAVQHKSEWAEGVGVQLGLTDASAVRAATEAILEAAASRDCDAGVLIERAVNTDGGVETLVGGTRDPSFGPVLVFGLGGTYAEAIDDISYRLAPIGRNEAIEMTEEIRAADLLDGFRGQPPVDRDAIAETLTAVGELLVDQEDILELEINPLLATETGAVALDALVALETE